MNPGTETKSRDGADPGRPAVEWIFGAVSAALVVALALFFAYQAAFGGVGPPDLRVIVVRSNEMANGTLLRVVVANEGDDAASAVTLSARRPGQAFAKRIELDYVAGHSTKSGAFLFDERVEAADVEVEIDGYSAL